MAQAQTFTYQNQDIAFQTIGEGKPLVILHGWGSSKRVMMPVAKNLAHLRACYVLDLPGFGDSPEPKRAWNIDDYTDAVQTFIEHLGAEKVDLLVHSYGGRITLKLCAREFGKTHIDKVLITGGAGMKPKRSLKFYIRKYTAKLLKAPFVLLPGSLREKALGWLRGTALWKSLGSSDYSKLSGVMRETFVKSVSEHLESTLPKIPHEVLLLWGENDDATPVYQGRRIEKGIQNAAMVIIQDAGHYAFLDKPKQFARIATAFFKG
ncbi:alpha/beta fold hydrolase [Gracilimonas mengyeensis]|uniref:Pimeloyl-ACP methyl ester carboxylesterase n=1 Tax=Gracilimonas mengyeensis TaxID=1302730 RepID=A0A521DDI1_9BACT|nr:alpha/beta hydrolase [Gracilimonas mengyeensis]SMO69749.1 Pimeloyl-ACP methyl ester carboxylesterase [Gracilimonas mengyeensis]